MKSLEQLRISFTPWSVMQGSSIFVEDAVGNCICNEFEWRGEKAMPNARLIAAAPHLYEAIRRAIEWEDAASRKEAVPEKWCDIVLAMRDAISKASGEATK